MCQRLFAVYQLRFFSVHERSKAQTKFISVYRLPTQACVCVCVCMSVSAFWRGALWFQKEIHHSGATCVCMCMYVCVS